jgi:hypothetical protein
MIVSVKAARMKAEVCGAVQSRNAAFAQIRFRECAQNRLRHREQAPCGLSRTGWSRRSFANGFLIGAWPWKAQEPTGFVSNVVEIGQVAAFANDVEQITMIAIGGIGPFASSTFAEIRSFQPDKQRSARRVSDIAHQPVAAFTPAIEEIMAAHRLGIARETLRQVRGLVLHDYAAARSPMRISG